MGGLWLSARAWPDGADPAEEVAIVSHAKRELLLRVHRFRLRREDLEDCYSQATLELVERARRGAVFAGRRHIANALEQRFISRIQDRRRALAGRSPMQAALEGAVSLGDLAEEQIAVVDLRAELEHLVLLRQELRRIEVLARTLTPDQRLALACQLGQMAPAEFCSRYGWSDEKYRKVAQRARRRLRRLIAQEDGAVPSCGEGSEQATGTCL